MTILQHTTTEINTMPEFAVREPETYRVGPDYVTLTPGAPNLIAINGAGVCEVYWSRIKADERLAEILEDWRGYRCFFAGRDIPQGASQYFIAGWNRAHADGQDHLRAADWNAFWEQTQDIQNAPDPDWKHMQEWL